MKHLRLILLAFLLFVTQSASAQSDGSAIEYKVKAVVLFNFAKYVHWPEKTFSSPTQPIQVCIIGKSPFGDVFQSADAPKEAQERPLKVVELSANATAKEVESCQIAYWTEVGEKGAKANLAGFKDHATLTVSDTESDDALVSFFLEDGKVRFKIKHKTAKGLGLDISSQLLKLAELDE